MPASPNNTIITAPGSVITTAAGDTWQIADGKVVVNGIVDQTTNNVIVLAYENGAVWQQNTDRLWWSKSTPSDLWGPSAGTTTSPLIGVASLDNTVLVGSVTAGLTFPAITDNNDDKWTITAGGQVAVNGAVDPTTSRVITLAFEDGKVWQENADFQWWSKSRASDAWGPPDGTPQSPVPASLPEPTVQYLDGSVVAYLNTATPGAYSVVAAADGDKGITFNYQQTNTNAGLIRNVEGNLTLNISGTLINSGRLTTQGGIGNAFTTLNLAVGSQLRNTGLINTLHASAGGVGGHLLISGSGTVFNSGTINIDGGSSTDFNMTGDIYNSGHLNINDLFGTQHSIITTGNIFNTGTIENHNQTTIQWGYSGTPQNLPNSTFTNNGVIESLDDVGHLTLAAGVFPHAADGSPVHDYHGSLFNTGQILAFGGGDAIEIAAPLKQSDAGHVDILNGATVKLDSTTDGGSINITSGMLDFGGDRVTFHGPAGATGFHSNAVLDGASAAFNFERSDINEVFQAVSPTAAELIINLTAVGAPQQIADIHLVGAYHASQFQLSGNEVIYTKAS